MCETKKCGSCECTKPVTEFKKSRRREDGLTSCCILCLSKFKAKRDNPEEKAKQKEFQAKYRQDNYEKLQEDKRQWYLENKEVTKERANIWYYENEERRKENSRLYRLKNNEYLKASKSEYNRLNPHLSKARVAKYYAKRLQATPIWLTDEHYKQIVDIYYEASLTDKHVDHIVPIQGLTVCGLHVPWNLQPLPMEENVSKSNRWWPDMPDENPLDTLEALGIRHKYKHLRSEYTPTKKSKLTRIFD